MGPFARGNWRSLGVLGNQPDDVGECVDLHPRLGRSGRISEGTNLDIGFHFEFWMRGLLAQAQQGVFRDCGSALPFATRFKGLFYVYEESATPPNQNCKNGHDV